MDPGGNLYLRPPPLTSMKQWLFKKNQRSQARVNRSRPLQIRQPGIHTAMQGRGIVGNLFGKITKSGLKSAGSIGKKLARRAASQGKRIGKRLVKRTARQGKRFVNKQVNTLKSKRFQRNILNKATKAIESKAKSIVTRKLSARSIPKTVTKNNIVKSLINANKKSVIRQLGKYRRHRRSHHRRRRRRRGIGIRNAAGIDIPVGLFH